MARMETGVLNFWRVTGWGLIGALLLLPLVAMQFTTEVTWTGSDFVFAGVALGTAGLASELSVRASRDAAYRTGCGIAIMASFLLVWINAAVGIIGDDNPLNLLYGAVVLVALVGGLSGQFRPAPMMRAMIAAASTQILISLIALVMAPDAPPGALPILGLNLVFVAMFAASAMLFARAARQQA